LENEQVRNFLQGLDEWMTMGADISYDSIADVEDKEEVSKIVLEIICLCEGFCEIREDTQTLKVLSNYLTISDNEKDQIKKYFRTNSSDHTLEKWIEYFSVGYKEPENDYQESETTANYNANEDFGEEDYSGIRSLVSNEVNKIMQQHQAHGKLGAFIDKQVASLQKTKEENIISFIQKSNKNIAFETVIEYMAISKAEILFTTCGMYIASKDGKELKHVRYADKDTKWQILTNDDVKKSGMSRLIIKDENNCILMELEDKSEYIELIKKILNDASSQISAETDVFQEETKWSQQAKNLAGEILVDTYKMCYKTSTIEAFRLFNDLSVATEQILGLCVYYDDAEPTEELVQSKIDTFLQYIPYPSKVSAGYSLGCKIVSMVHFACDKPNVIPMKLENLIKYICEKCNLEKYYAFTPNRNTDEKKKTSQKETWKKLWDEAALPYRILKQEATKKEIEEIGLEMAGVAVGVGVPLVYSVIDSILFWASLGIAFVPGVDLIFLPASGAILAGGAVGGGIAKIVSRVKHEDIKESSKRELWKAEKSYVNLYNNIQGIRDDDIRKLFTDEIIKAAYKTDSTIKECLRSYSSDKHAKDEFYIQTINEKLSKISTKGKDGFYLIAFSDMEKDESMAILSGLLKKMYDVPVHNQSLTLQHHQVLDVFVSNKKYDMALVFTYEGMAITKKMIGDGERADKFVYYKEITHFREDSDKSLLYLTVGHTDKPQDEVAISFADPICLKELLLRLRAIGATIFA
jgi:hypothetical protein